ncbi:MAG: DUF5596 domain-containing protein [Clostridia bacterium]|nr:DUF5596 domain-containing protein [Clostridia bacterium]
MENRKEIVKKWYRELHFSPDYDEEFYACLQRTDLSDLTCFQSYDYKKNTPQKNLLACLYFCEALEKEYQEAGISREILLDGLLDLVLWNESYYQVHQHIGLTEFPWLDRTFLMQIFRLGRLQFSMFPSEFDIEELGVKVGEPVLEVHIPGGLALRYEECEKSFAQAKVFFQKYYPDFPQEWCICHSWLLDETMLPLLGENSNVAKFQTFFTPIGKNESDSAIRFTFLWNTTRENLENVQPKSGFARRLKEKALAGETFYEVLGIRKM